MIKFEDCVPKNFKLTVTTRYGYAMIRSFPKYSIIVISEEVHFTRAYYRVLLVKNRRRKPYQEIYCLPQYGYKARKIVSASDIENSISELLALNGFDYWIHDLFS